MTRNVRLAIALFMLGGGAGCEASLDDDIQDEESPVGGDGDRGDGDGDSGDGDSGDGDSGDGDTGDGDSGDGDSGDGDSGDGDTGDGDTGDGDNGDGDRGDGDTGDGDTGDGDTGDGDTGDAGVGDGDTGDGDTGDGDTGDGDMGDGDTGEPADIDVPFTSIDGFSEHVRSDGGDISIVSDGAADDGSAVALMLPGDPNLSANDQAGPPYASELVYGEFFTYGKFEVRVRFASCAASEEVVNGIFTYFRDGSDENGNGISDNSEIDIELLCGTPHILWLTTYTDFDDFAPGELRKLSRKLDMRTGQYEDYTDWPPAVTNQGTLDGVAIPGFPGSDFYELGFEWRENMVRYYMRLDGKEVDLFTIDEASRIPRRPSQFLMNIWHAAQHWTDGSAADYPANDSTMVVDYVKIWR